MKKLLFLTLPESYVMTTKSKIPKKFSYFLEIAQYFINKYEVNAVDCLDSKFSNGEVLRNITMKKYDVVIINVRIEGIVDTLKMIPLIRNISENTKILIY
ncbi:MAG: hypothetical protein LBU14_05725 [Candidatus Peribacteria bacterium]|jgi:hypothetical protein|nr:hypothetical protein [Candidatus Peribacteria bacterium]